MENCIFCKIANHVIPSSVVYEDDDVIAFLDISQTTMGHTLVVPKKHFTNIFDIDEENAVEIMKAIRVVSNKLKEKLNVSAVNVINNSGELAGQTVMHIHFHVIPRYENDGIVISPKQTEPNFDLLKQIQEKINN